MRISTKQIQQLGINAILEQQGKVSNTQMQVSSGKKNLTAADDPVAAAKIVDLEQSITRAEQHRENGTIADGRLRLTESVLAAIGDVMHRVRELVIQAKNDSQNNETRSLIATEIGQLLEETQSLANNQDGNGEYLFSGYKSQTIPFTRDPLSGFNFNGDEGSRAIQIGTASQVVVAESGNSIFMQIRNGNGTFVATPALSNSGSGIIDPGSVNDISLYDVHDYRIRFTSPTTYDLIDDTTAATIASGQAYTSGAAISVSGVQVTISGDPIAGDEFTLTPSTDQDVFSTLGNIVNVLATGVSANQSHTQMHNNLNRLLSEIDQAQDHLIEARARVGNRMQTIEIQDELNESYIVHMQKTLSMTQDLDYADAISRLSLQLNVLEAAQSAFVRVQGLTLFNFLR
jgi:flagellar hook-associated protein 3 FlgL